MALRGTLAPPKTGRVASEIVGALRRRSTRQTPTVAKHARRGERAWGAAAKGGTGARSASEALRFASPRRLSVGREAAARGVARTVGGVARIDLRDHLEPLARCAQLGDVVVT